MKNWSAEIINDPDDDYNLTIDIYNNETHCAQIRKINEDIHLVWFASQEDQVIPLEWLLELLKQAKTDL